MHVIHGSLVLLSHIIDLLSALALSLKHWRLCAVIFARITFTINLLSFLVAADNQNKAVSLLINTFGCHSLHLVATIDRT